MNHLEQLVAEWLQYRGYFVRTSVPVGPRGRGGYEGELDVVAVHIREGRFLHVECSLDAASKKNREARYQLKFERGRRYAREVFDGLDLPEVPEQILVLQFASGVDRTFGGARMITVRELVHEIHDGLRETSPARQAVSVNLPLLRTLQLMADAMRHPPASTDVHRLLQATTSTL